MRIRKIHLENHRILGDLTLDFTNDKGEVHGTIMLAGENGTGKSLILDIIFQFSNLSLDSEKRNEKRKFEIELSELEMGILKGIPEMSNYLSNPIRGNMEKPESLTTYFRNALTTNLFVYCKGNSYSKYMNISVSDLSILIVDSSIIFLQKVLPTLTAIQAIQPYRHVFGMF